MAYVFLNPEFDNHFFFCPFHEEKGFRLSNRLKDALQVEDKEDVEPQMKKLREQSGLKVAFIKTKL